MDEGDGISQSSPGIPGIFIGGLRRRIERLIVNHRVKTGYEAYETREYL